MRGFTARDTPCMGLVDRRPVVCRNLAMGFWVPLHYLATLAETSKVERRPALTLSPPPHLGFRAAPMLVLCTFLHHAV